MELADLQAKIDEFGPAAFVTTVGDDGKPHVVSARVSFADGEVAAEVGKTTAANVGRGSTVTLLWPAPDGGAYCLIVDGAGSIGAGAASLTVEPVRAVLHRLASAPDAGPSCVTVLDRR